eukprot:12093689-Karenia_brevis.AAC.1
MLGTSDYSEDATRFKVLYITEGHLHQHHLNGIGRFTTQSGTTVIALTFKASSIAILMKDLCGFWNP